MKLSEYRIVSKAPEHVKSFANYLREHIDPNNNLDCDVVIETVKRKDISGLPGECASPPDDGVEDEFGVRVFSTFEDNSDTPAQRVTKLAGKYFEEREYLAAESFDGRKGEYEVFIFPEN